MFQELKILHRKMTGFFALILVLFTLVFAGLVYMDHRYSSQAGVDKGLQFAVQRVHSLYEVPPNYGLMAMNDDVEIQHSRGSEKIQIPLYYILRDDNLLITAASSGFDEMNDLSLEPAQKALRENEGNYQTLEVEGKKMRLYSEPINIDGQYGVVQTYFDFSIIYHFINKFTRIFLFIGLIGVLAAALVARGLAGKAILPIQKSWQHQRDFVADASHELRTPLTIIQSNLDAAMSDEDGSIQDNRKWLENAYSETQNMGKLINDLLLLARIDSKEIELNMEQFNLSLLLLEIVEQFKPVFNSRDLNFKCNIQHGVMILGDKSRIREMVGIFLDNAVKYTPSAGSLELTMSESVKHAEIMFIDSGVGIDDKEKEDIFKRFYRGDKARTHKQGGTGLGLSIASWIIKSHRGSIRVESRVGAGSIFIVELPVDNDE